MDKNTRKASAVTYVNVNRAKKGYREKYKAENDAAVRKFAKKIGKQEDGSDFTDEEWRTFFTEVLIPQDESREKLMIDLFKNDRDELERLLILHNTRAGENIAEVYFKRYLKYSPVKWHDLEDFKQMANEGLVVAAHKFDFNRKNRFLTYATWWMLNKVRKHYSDKGSSYLHSSINAPICPQDPSNTTTLEEVLSPEEVSPDFHSPSNDEGAADHMDRQIAKANVDIYNAIKGIGEIPLDNIEKNKVRQVMGYLLSIVERNENSYDNKQIFLYLFKKVFNKCFAMPDIPSESRNRLKTYLSEAAKSKAELLTRLHMDEKQYEVACKKLTRGDYNGV